MIIVIRAYCSDNQSPWRVLASHESNFLPYDYRTLNIFGANSNNAPMTDMSLAQTQF